MGFHDWSMGLRMGEKVDCSRCKWRGLYMKEVEAALFPERLRVCVYCGEKFAPHHRGHKRFCSDRCRGNFHQRAHIARKKAAE